MAAAAELLGYRGDIQLSLAAEAHAEPAARKLAKKCSYFDILDGQRVVHQSFAVFLLGREALHLITGNPDPCQRPFPVAREKMQLLRHPGWTARSSPVLRSLPPWPRSAPFDHR